MNDLIRVLVVDPAAIARRVLRETLDKDPRLEVVGTARSGHDAREKVAELDPDVITLDLGGLLLDSMELLGALPAGRPRVIVVSPAGEERGRTQIALDAGAADFVVKPAALGPKQLGELGELLAQKILTSRPPPSSRRRLLGKRVVVIGASTGGPQALSTLLARLPAELPVPIAAVVHMPPGFTADFARRLDRDSALDVMEAQDGLALRPGLVVVGQAGVHIRIERLGERAMVVLGPRPYESPHCPSIDVLFESAAAAYDSGVLAVVLTGMGVDGLEGARAVHNAGGTVLTEAESSSVVYGMPRSVFRAGLADAEAPIEEMAGMITAFL
jgi:two-component system, chemotaxis family, protein-glutamate methylesterase/glutaminase